MSGNELTVEMLMKACDEMQRQSHDRMVGHARSVSAFWNSVPAHLQDHPLVKEMACLIGHAVHPSVADDYQRRYEELLRG